MIIYISIYSSDIEDAGDCNDNLVKAPSSNNVTGNHSVMKQSYCQCINTNVSETICVRSWNPFEDALPDWTKSCKSHS